VLDDLSDETADHDPRPHAVDARGRLAKVRLAGSSPVVRSIGTPGLARGYTRLTCSFGSSVVLLALPGRPEQWAAVTACTHALCAWIVLALLHPRPRRGRAPMSTSVSTPGEAWGNATGRLGND
jgi:hypothetical protein